MKTITDTIITLNRPGAQKPEDLPLSQLLRDIASSQTERGLPLPEQRKRYRLLDAIDAMSDGKMSFEDSDHALLVQLTESMPWSWVDRAWAAVADAVSGA